MSKAFFRFLRGELNGYYLNRINDTMNSFSSDIKKFLSEFKTQQFEYGKISNETMYNIGKFASIFLLRLKSAETLTALYMTDSHIVDGCEFSERGLYKIADEVFEFFHTEDDSGAYYIFVHTTQEEYTDDINTLATARNRSSLVGDEPVLGYISSSETDLFDAEGNIKSEKILSTPPADEAYADYYGNNFLYLSEGDDSEADNLIRMRMSDSEIVDGIEYSERGLFIIPTEIFDDINTLASPQQRSSLIGNETPIGYISEYETDVLDEEGNIKPEKISSTPPVTGAYSEYYGDKFLLLAEASIEDSYREIDPEMYMALFKALQWIRYNGVSVASLVKIIDLTCPEGLVKISNIESASDGTHVNVYYVYDETAPVEKRPQRLSMLEYIVSLKFKQVVLSELNI